MFSEQLLGRRVQKTRHCDEALELPKATHIDQDEQNTRSSPV